MNRPRRWLAAGLIGGTIVRALALPTSGTGDVGIWKVWSFGASHDALGVYGVGGVPPERRVLQWQGDEMTVDYPPLAIAELAVVGRVYARLDRGFHDTPTLNAFVKLPGLIAEVVLVVVLLTWGTELLGRPRAAWTALAVWLNPLVILNGSLLGYLDAQMAVPLVLAIMTAWANLSTMAGALFAVAVLTKAQAIFAGPPLLAILAVRSDSWRRPARAVIGGGVVTAATVLPYVLHGAWTNLVQALGRLATHDMLSAQAANIWWVFTWVLRVADVHGEWGWWPALTQEVQILKISRAVALGYPDARTVGLFLVALAIGWACWQVRHGLTLGRAAAISGWSLYAYAMLAAQVHENHWYAAVMLFALAAGADHRYRATFWALTAIAALNLYLFYGMVAGWHSGLNRHWTGIDATLVLSVVNFAVFCRAGWLLATDPASTGAVRKPAPSV